MKNKITALGLIITMIFSLLAAPMTGVAAGDILIPSIDLSDDSFLYAGSPIENDNSTSERRNNIKLDSGLIFSEYFGFVDTVDDLGKGTSLRIGITDERDSTSNPPNVNITIPDGFYTTGESGSCSVEMDVYIDEKTDFNLWDKNYDRSAFYTQFYASISSMNKRALVWDQSLYTSVDSSNNLSTEEGSYDYEEKKWYKVKIDLSWEPEGSNFNYIYDAFVSLGENGEMVQVVDGEPALLGASKITQIGFCSPRLKKYPRWAALDNILLCRERKMPVVELIEYEYNGEIFEAGENNIIPHDAEKLFLTLSDYIAEVNEGDVLLYILDGDEKEECEISKTEYDAENYKIIITPEAKLKDGEQYEVVLTENILAAPEIYMPKEQSAIFKTTEEPAKNSAVKESFENTAVIEGADLTLDSGIIISQGSGYVRTGEISEEHKQSLILGTRENGTKMPKIDIPLNGVQTVGQNGNARLEFDYLIGVKPTYEGGSIPDAWYSSGAFRFGSDEVADKKFFYWHDTIRNNYSHTVEFEYETDKWYKVIADLSWTASGTKFNYTYDIQINDGETTVTEYQFKINAALFTSISFFAPKLVNKEVWAALDNIELIAQKPLPNIKGFEAFDNLETYENAGALSPDVVKIANKKLLAVSLSEAIIDADESLVSLKENGIDVSIEKAGYDSDKNAILLLLKEELKENTRYTFELSPETQVWQGVMMGKKRRADFTTTASGLAVENIKIEVSGDEAQICADVLNLSDTPKKAYIIASVWDGDKFIKQKVAISEPQGQGEETATITIEGIESTNTIQVYAWDSIFGAKMLTSGIISD